MARIELEDASITFRLRERRRITLKEFLLRRMFDVTNNPLQEVHALRSISLKISEGDRVAVIGHNGAGKSTFLKMLAGIYPPTSGRRIVEGSISSMLDIGLGIEGDASGRENIANRGYLLGQTPTQVIEKTPEIVAFSELGEFLDMPVRFYSSGMSVRLTFSIATAIEPEILLIDEIFGAGDMSFQEKARNRMLELVQSARILVLASHDLRLVKELCDRAIWLDHGRIVDIGAPTLIVDRFERYMRGEESLAA